MASHIFGKEVELLERSRQLANSGAFGDEAISAIVDGYDKLLRETRHLVRISDRSEKNLRNAHSTIESQNAELETAHAHLGDHAETLEAQVKARTEDLKLSQLKLEKLVERGIGLSSEIREDRLLEMIIVSAKEIANADGGTLYLRKEDNLEFEVLRTSSLDITLGGATGKPIDLPPVALFDKETSDPNYGNVASCAALSGETILVDDAYTDDRFDFSGTRKFDETTGYRSKSFLTVPLIPRGKQVLGVVQLLNAKDAETGKVIPFDSEVVGFVEALASQAAIALDNQNLIEAQKELLDSFIQLIAGAIDAKSPYTGGHCNRVPELAMMLAEAAVGQSDGPFADFDLANDDEWREFRIGAWLHDCGKVTTPEYVVDKATKLETIHNRIHEVRMRFEVLLRDARIEFLERNLAGDAVEESALMLRQEKLTQEFEFIAECNIGGEFMGEDKMARVQEIALQEWTRNFDDRLGQSPAELKRFGGGAEQALPARENLLADKPEHIVERDDSDPFGDNPHGFKMEVPEHLYNYGEVYNLCIARGTLTTEERYKINEHIIQTINMLNALPYPKHLEKIPEIAANHHETMIGTGYPRKLTKEEMSVPSRIMAIADIFEALTASDRPYKAPKPLSEAVKIMGFMRNDQHIDPDLFDLFLTSGVYKRYADRFLSHEQVDDIDIAAYVTGHAKI